MAVFIGNRKLTSLLLLCIIAAATVIPPWAEAQIPCNDIFDTLFPCVDYVSHGGAVPAGCCWALQGVVNTWMATKADRQSVCECMKGAVSALPSEEQECAAALPELCEVPVPFKISPNVDCSQVN